MRALPIEERKLSETSDFFTIYREQLLQLPLTMKVLGYFLVYQVKIWEVTPDMGETFILTSSEIADGLIDFDLIKKTTAPNKSVTKILERLVECSLVIQLTPDKIKNPDKLKPDIARSVKNVKLPPKAKYCYILTPQGLEVLRHINPYIHLFPEEPLLPVVLRKADIQLRELFRRTYFFSESTLEKLCIVKDTGMQEVVLKKVDLETAKSFFKNLPEIKAEELEEYLRTNRIQMTEKLSNALKRAFMDSDSTTYYMLEIAFLESL